MDLLEFLGATPVGQEQLNTMIDDIETSILQNRQSRATGPN